MLKCALRKRTCSPWPQVWRVADLKYGAQSGGRRSKHQIITLWNGGDGVKSGCAPLWPRAWQDAHLRPGPISALFTFGLETQTLSLSLWNWLDTMKPGKEKTARLNGVPSERSFCLVPLLVFSLFFLFLAFLASRQHQGPTGRERHCHKIRHDCIVMLSDCASVQFGAQALRYPSNFNFLKKSSRTQMCSLLCRRGATRWRRFDDPGEPYLVASSRSRSAVSAKFSGTCWI